MSDANPFAPNPALAFLTGLTKSTMDTFKDEHDKDEAERKRQQGVDYELLMAGMKQMEPNLTPSQAKEIMTRAVDIFKPKGHGGIKEKLAEMFGHGQPHEMMAGRILSEASQRPRMNVQLPDQTIAPDGGGSTRLRTVTMPPPPQFEPEKTYHEQDIADDEHKYATQLNVALAKQDNAQKLRDQSRREQNQAIFDRHMKEIGAKDTNKISMRVRQKAYEINPSDPTNPETMQLAADQLLGETKQKQELAGTQIELNRRRLKEIDDKLKVAWARVDVAKTNAGAHAQAVKYRDDPQWKGMWLKAGTSAQAAKTARVQAAQMYSKFQADGDSDWLEEAKKFESVAEGLEADVQKQIDGMEQREYHMSGGTKMGGVTTGGVSLPANPASTARPSFNLRQWRTDHPNATAAEIDAKRKKFKGYNIIE